MNYLKLRSGLENLGTNIFTPRLASEIIGSSIESTRNMLERYKKLDAVVSPKRGLYYLSDKPPEPYEISYHLYQPSYISFEKALSDYNIIPEVVYAITCATTKPTRTFTSMGIGYTYQTIKQVAYTGYLKEKNYYIAEPEKALADYLYYVAIENKTLNDRLELRKINKGLALRYCALFQSRPLDTLVKEVLC